MRDKYVGRPRTYRLAKEYRALKSLLQEMQSEGSRRPGAAGGARKRRP